MRLISFAVLLGLSAVVGGCATQEGLRKVHEDIWRVQAQLESLSRQVGEIDSLVARQGDDTQRRWAELSTDGGDVRQQVDQVQARLTEVSRRLADMSRGLEAMRIYGGGGPAGPPSGQPSAAAAGDTAPQAGPAPILDAGELYNLAFRDMEAKNYPLAISEFSQYLESFPESDLADNASYWLGECHAIRKEYAKAVAAFQRILDQYPDSDKVPAAMLKLGYVLPEVKERTKAEKMLRGLIAKYPDSEEAAKAKQRLKAVGGSAKGRGR